MISNRSTRYSHVFIIDASSVHSIKIDLQNAVRSLGSENSQKTWEDALKYFEREGANKNWLIGFESADDPTLPLHELIPKSDHGTIFITSRNRDLFLLTTKELQWELGPMTTEEALDTLLHSAQRAMTPSQDDLENGTELVERLGRLPLAVVQAGAYCFQKSLMIDGLQVQFTFRHYLGEMDRYSRDVMEHSATHSLEGYNKSVYQSLSMSCSALPQRARDFLHLCGYLNHSQIPLIMFDYAVDGRFRVVGMTGSLDSQPVIEAKLASILESPGKSTIIHLHKLVYTLKMFSLVVTSMAPNSMMLNFHALVSAWSRDTLSLEQKQFYSALATRVVSTCSAEDQYYRVHASLLPHITEILKQPGDLHLNDMHSLAGRLDWGGMTREAEAIYRRMQERCIKDFGMSDRKTLIALENLANCLNRQGRHEEAMEMQQVAILGRRKLHPENDREILQVENNLATTYLSQERWREAEEILTRILPMLKQTLGIRDPNTTGAMINLANAYGQQGRHQEAVEIHREALEIRRQVCGNDHPDTLLEMTNLANSYIRLNRLDEAQKLEEEALEMMKNTNGMDNPMTLRTMSNLAETYSVQGKHTEALALGEQALEGRKRVLGRRHPDVLKTMCLVAMIYFQLDLIPEGVQLQEELRELEGGEGNFSKVLSGNLALWFNI